MNGEIKQKQMDVKELFRQFAQSKDLEIREILIKKHLYIAEILSKKYTNKGIEYDDIYQVACLGLIYAVDRFDISKGYEFSSFATPTIIGEIKKYFRDKGWSIRVPRRIQEMSKNINNAKNFLSQDLQRIPTVLEIAEYLNLSEESVLEAMEASNVYTVSSLDSTIENENDDKNINLKVLIGEDDKYYEMIENNDFVERAMKKLSDIERKIIEDRYFKKKTQISIAEEVGLSQMTVSRLEKKILSKFKQEYQKIN